MALLAVAQFAPGSDDVANLRTITELAERAVARGATLVLLPEYSSYFTPEPGEDWLRAAQHLGAAARHLAELGDFGLERAGAVQNGLGVNGLDGRQIGLGAGAQQQGVGRFQGFCAHGGREWRRVSL